MIYVRFSKHTNSAQKPKNSDQLIFAFDPDSLYQANLTAQIAAYELCDRIGDSTVSFINNGQQGPMWIVFDGNVSYGTFYVESSENFNFLISENFGNGYDDLIYKPTSDDIRTTVFQL